MTRLILVRHGESQANALKIFTGHLDYDLSEKGFAEAEMVASYLVPREVIDHVYASDLIRAVHTAEPTARALGLSIHTDARLREVDLGDWTGTPLTGKEDSDPENFRKKQEDPSHFRYPNGEYLPEYYDHVIECITEIADKYPDQTILIAAHGGTVRAFCAFASGYSREEMSSFGAPIVNASINIFEWNGTKATPLVLNFTDHLKK